MKKTIIGFALNHEMSLVVAPVPGSQKVPVSEMRIGVGGSPVTIARTMRAFGQHAHILGVVGRDGEQAKFKHALTEWGVSHSLFPLRERTPVGIFIINGGGEATNYTHRDPLVLDGDAESVLKHITDVAADPEVGCVIATSVRPEDVALVEAMFAAAPANAARVLNPNLHLIQDEAKFKTICAQANLLILNRVEAQTALKVGQDEGDWNLAEDLLDFTAEVIVTLGETGSVYLNRGREGFYTPAPKVEVKDTTGAGHTYLGAYVAARLQHLHVSDAMRIATAAAAAKIRHIGGYIPPTPEDVREIFGVIA